MTLVEREGGRMYYRTSVGKAESVGQAVTAQSKLGDRRGKADYLYSQPAQGQKGHPRQPHRPWRLLWQASLDARGHAKNYVANQLKLQRRFDLVVSTCSASQTTLAPEVSRQRAGSTVISSPEHSRAAHPSASSPTPFFCDIPSTRQRLRREHTDDEISTTIATTDRRNRT